MHKRNWMAGLWLSLLSLPAACGAAEPAPATAPAAAPTAAPSAKEQASIAGYAVGYNVGQSIRSQGMPVDLEAVIEGIRTGVAGKPPRIAAQALQAAMVSLEERMRKAALDKATSAAREYMASNGKRKGVVTTASGLQYEVLKAGAGGAAPADTSRVFINYEGKLLDGTVFDSSIARGEPVEFVVNLLIQGWQEALKLMHPGDKWRLHVPPELAYGDRGAAGAIPIPPNAALIFELELLEIKPAG